MAAFMMIDLVARCSLLVAGYWFLVIGSSLLVARCRVALLAVGFSIKNE
jgi:hypothetical protein